MELNKSSVILGIVILLALVSFVFADTYFFTDANHNNNSIYNVSQINSTLYCDDTGCYELTELNTTTTETDPYWTANQSSYFTKANIDSFGYYNSTDFSISDYATNVKVDSLGNFSAWDKDYNDLINTPTFTNDTWVDTYFVRFTELVGQIGNWTLDKVDYYTSAEVDTEITNANTSMKNYVDGKYVPYTGSNQNIDLGDNNFSVNGSTLFVNSNSGNVGIGTDSPSQKFEVNQEDAESILSIARGGSNPSFATPAGSLQFTQDYSGVPQVWGTVDVGTNAAGSTRTSMDLSVKGAGGAITKGLTLYGSNAGVYVGIGTNNPQNVLNVIGDINSTGNFIGNGSLLTGISVTETDPIFTVWDNFTGIPTATPSNGDTTHLSTANHIYDFVIAFGYATTTYVDNLVATYTHLSNYTDDLGDRGYTSNSNFTNDEGYTTNTGTVTSIATTAPISGGTITTSGTISLATATPSNGDTTHASTADQIYDWVIGLNYVANAITSLAGDGSPQLGNYLDTNSYNIGSTTDEIENVYVATNSRIYFGDGQEASIYYNSTHLIIG